MFLYVNHFCFSKIVLNFSGDVKENLVPKASSSHNFSIYHQNLNSISEHNYIRLSLLRSFVSVHEFDSTSVSETQLDSNTCTVNENLEIVDQTLIRANNSSNTKRCIVAFTTNTLFPSGYQISATQRNPQSLKYCSVVSYAILFPFYHSASQSHDVFESLQITLNLRIQ